MKLSTCTRQDPRLLHRLTQVRQQLTADTVFLLSNPANLRYLFNYTGEAACALISREQSYLITDYRFAQQALDECANLQVVCRDREQQRLGQTIAALLPLCAAQTISQLWFEDAWIPQQTYQALRTDNASLEFSPAPDLLSRLRSVKDQTEIQALRGAAEIADQALAHCVGLLQPGIRETEFALELDYQLRKHGADALSFDTIVGFGARSALPHCPPGATRLQAGDLIVVDFGARLDGYGSDMTRSFVAGTATPRQAAMYATVLAAQQAACASLRAGQSAADANRAANTVLQASEFAAYASTGLGHGIGLQLHEFPIITPQLEHHFQAGQVITIEPGIYIPGYGGIRIEDDVLITEHGYECLSRAEKKFELPVAA